MDIIAYTLFGVKNNDLYRLQKTGRPAG